MGIRLLSMTPPVSIFTKSKGKRSITMKDKQSMVYAVRYVTEADGTQTAIYMHEVIMGLPPAGYYIEHINGNTLDNQRANLRFSPILKGGI